MKVTLSMVDNSNEKSSVGVYMADPTGASYDGVMGDAVTDVIGSLRVAVATLSTMNEVDRSATVIVGQTPAIPPTDPYAQRERKLKVTQVDTVTNQVSFFTIPSPNNDTLSQTGTDVVDHVNNVLAAGFVTVYEAVCTSKLGNPVVVTAMEIVGRNS